MNPNTLAQICDVVESQYTLFGRPKSQWSLWERALSWFFPPKELHEIGPIDKSSLGYMYRLSRTEGYERNLVEINLAVRIGKVIVGQAAPVYQRGTRESRMAKLREE
jgi:hypothetical protein